MDPISLVAAPVAFALVGGALWLGHRRRATRDATWRAIADARDGVFEEAKIGLWRSTPAAIVVPDGHARVRLDTYIVRTGQSTITFTRARACFAVADAPAFEVRPKGLLATVGELVGMADVQLGGDARFDEEHTVKCTAADAVREVWTPDAKRALLERIPGARVESDGRLITARILGALSDPEKIDGMLALVGELASYGARELEAYAAHPGARFTPPGGEWASRTRPRLAVSTEKTSVDAALRCSPEGLHLLLACRAERPELEPFTGTLPSGDGLPRGVVTDELRRPIEALGDCTLEHDGQRVLLSFDRLPSETAFAAGVEVASAVAIGSGRLGAFR